MKTYTQKPLIAFVVPCYNEEEMLHITIVKLSEVIKGYISNELVHEDSFILFINDGSKDKTWEVLLDNQNDCVRAIKLSNNVGHQNALLAGLHYVTNKVDCCISLDADLQDDVSVIEQMIDNYKKGYAIVYGVRDSRTTDSMMKRQTAQFFYRLMKSMGCDLVFNHADYRLLSNKVLKEFQKYKEVNLFLRGLFPLMGFTSTNVYYARKERIAGETKYPFSKMMQLAINGITSFSNLPLKLITRIGLFVFIGSIITSVWVAIVVIFGKNVPGWASITLPMYFLGGVQLLALGVIGEYLGKIYLETKGRPRFHIEEEIGCSVSWEESTLQFKS